MSAPVEIPLSHEQRELWDQLTAELRFNQAQLSTFCDALFRGVGVTGVRNVQLLTDATGARLVAEIPDAPNGKKP